MGPALLALGLLSLLAATKRTCACTGPPDGSLELAQRIEEFRVSKIDWRRVEVSFKNYGGNLQYFMHAAAYECPANDYYIWSIPPVAVNCSVQGNLCVVDVGNLAPCTSYCLGVSARDGDRNHVWGNTTILDVYTFNSLDTDSGFNIDTSTNKLRGHWTLSEESEACISSYVEYAVNISYTVDINDDPKQLIENVIKVPKVLKSAMRFATPLAVVNCKPVTYTVSIYLKYKINGNEVQDEVYNTRVTARFTPEPTTELKALYIPKEIGEYYPSDGDTILVTWKFGRGSECIDFYRADMYGDSGAGATTDTTDDNTISEPTDSNEPERVTTTLPWASSVITDTSLTGKTRLTLARRARASVPQQGSRPALRGPSWRYCPRPDQAPSSSDDPPTPAEDTAMDATDPDWIPNPHLRPTPHTPLTPRPRPHGRLLDTAAPSARRLRRLLQRGLDVVRPTAPTPAPTQATAATTNTVVEGEAGRMQGVAIIECTSCETELRIPTRASFSDGYFGRNAVKPFCPEFGGSITTGISNINDLKEVTYPQTAIFSQTDLNNDFGMAFFYGLSEPANLQVFVWGHVAETDKYTAGTCTDIVPFSTWPRDGVVLRTRAHEAEIKWSVEGAHDTPYVIQVWCLVDGKSLFSDVFSLDLLPGDKTVTVLVSGLENDQIYDCYAKFSADAVFSVCSEPVRVRTTTKDARISDVSMTEQGALSWTDLINDYGTANYVVNATRKELQPACCRTQVQTYLFHATHSCCANFGSSLPTGTPFAVSVSTRDDGADIVRTQSDTIRLALPEQDGPDAPDAFALSKQPAPSCSNEVLVQVCPPCEPRGEVHSYRFSVPGPSGSMTIDDSIMTVDKATGILSMPFTQLFPTFNWCQCDGHNVTFEVVAENLKLNKSSAALNVTVSVPRTCPSMPSRAALVSNFDLSTDTDDGRAVVRFSRSLFESESSELEPLSYRLLVAEKGSEAMEGGCAASDQYIHTWAEAHQYPRVLLYSPTDPGWNPFIDSSCNESGMCSYTLGDSTCYAYQSKTFCNGQLRADTTYSVRLRAVFDSAGMFYVETAPLFFEECGLRNYMYTYMWYSAILIILAVVAMYLVCKYCAKHHTCSLSCTMGRRRGRVGSEVLSRLVWFRWPPWGPAPDTDADLYRGHGVPLAGDALVGVPPLYSVCLFRLLPLPCLMSPQLQREFEALCALSAQYAAGAASRAGHLPQNACKNRYCNIIPFDRTRVRLSGSTDDDIANYINASFVAGYTGRTEYIASQGPKEGTTKDFWFMVYEQNVRLIIMLTKLMEDGKNKCHQYYPELGDRYMWGDLAVECSVQNDLPTYTLRTIVMNKGSEQRLVHHLHFLDWPDFGCPASSVHVLQFCRTVRRHALLFPGLMVVHCSAGVGRTGTLIAVDILLQRLKAKKKIDIFGVVMRLREQRPFMVQCQEQYIFIYKCLKAALEEPHTKIFNAPCPFPVTKNMHLQSGLQMVKKSILSSWKK